MHRILRPHQVKGFSFASSGPKIRGAREPEDDGEDRDSFYELQVVDKTLNRLFHYFKNTVNLFIHIARIPIGDSPRIHPNILKCLLHSPVAKGYRLVVIASRAMVCKTPTYYLILNFLAYTRGCVFLRSHILILLLLILLIFHHIHS